MQTKSILLSALTLLTPHTVSAACTSPDGFFELSAIEAFEPSSRPGHIIRRFGFEVMETGDSADNRTTSCEAAWSRLVSVGYPQSYVCMTGAGVVMESCGCCCYCTYRVGLLISDVCVDTL